MLTCYLLKESAEHWEENYCSGSCLSSFRFFCKGFKHSVMMAWCLTFFKTLAQTQDCLAVPKTQWKSSFFTPPVEVEVKPGNRLWSLLPTSLLIWCTVTAPSLVARTCALCRIVLAKIIKNQPVTGVPAGVDRVLWLKEKSCNMLSIYPIYVFV